VLVPVDGSEKDRRVIPAAAALADLADGDLHVISVLPTPPDTLSPRAVAMGAADALGEMRRDMWTKVRRIADRLIADTGRSVTAEVAEGPDVAAILVNSATWRAADIVVMATRAPGAVSRALLGSVADHVVRESPRPVVLVPPGAHDGVPLSLRRVLVPLDGSERSEAALDLLLSLKHARALEFVLLEVVTVGALLQWAPESTELRPYGDPDFAEARANAERRLNVVAERLQQDGERAVLTRIVEELDPAAAIVRVAREDSVDFIAMSTRGIGGIERLVLGSVAEKVVRESDLPVLLVKPRDP
jgi:nucleotide-binding universal stress UspA family protein